MLNELKKFKVQTILVKISVKEKNSLYTKLIPSCSDIDEAFKSMHQSIMSRIKKYACEDWIVLDTIVKTAFIFLKVSTKRINSIKN